MPITADFHLHSAFSGDSDAPMEAMVLRAATAGLTQICFTEHMDLDYPATPSAPPGFFTLNLDSYLYGLLQYREKYADKLKIRFGMELGMQPHLTAENTRIAGSFDFDFIIASTHVAKRMDPYEPSYFADRSDEEGYRIYFEETLACMEAFSDFDVYGHIDYVIRYGKNRDAGYSYDKYRDLFDRMIELLLEKGKGIECNTGGLRRGLKEAHPCTEFLRRYRQKGGRIITVGSDAHTPADIAAGFGRAAEILSACGFTHYCTFEKRTPTFHTL